MRPLSAAYSDMAAGPSYQSRWSSATLRTAADSAFIDDVQWSWKLDSEDVPRLGVHDGLDDGQADVAAGDGAQPARAQHGLQHLHGRGLDVGAGDGEPGRSVFGVAEAPAQLDLAPD